MIKSITILSDHILTHSRSNFSVQHLNEILANKIDSEMEINVVSAINIKCPLISIMLNHLMAFD